MPACKIVSVGVLAAAVFTVSCGKQTETESNLTYRVGDRAFAGLLRKVHRPSIKICMASDQNTLKHRSDVVHAIEEWTSALIGFTKEPVTQKVEFVAPNAADCDGVVRVGSYSPAYTSMGNRPEVNLAYDGWFGSRTVALHEFGHAFGLLDTYAGTGGSCIPNQPNSVMCRASYDNLKQDDIDGLQKAYMGTLARGFAADDDRIPMVVE